MSDLPTALKQRATRFVRDRTRPRVHRWFFEDLIARTGNFSNTTWLGYPIWQNVLDLWLIQEAIAEIKPALLIETGTNRGGSARFYAHLLDLLEHGRVMTVDVEKLHDISHPRIEFLIGSSVEPEIVERMQRAAAEADGPVMAILDSDHAQRHVAAELEVYPQMVSVGSLLLVQDGVIDVLPTLAADRPGPLPAIEAFMARHPEFVPDSRRSERFLITHHPSGWFRRSR